MEIFDLRTDDLCYFCEICENQINFSSFAFEEREGLESTSF